MWHVDLKNDGIGKFQGVLQKHNTERRGCAMGTRSIDNGTAVWRTGMWGIADGPNVHKVPPLHAPAPALASDSSCWCSGYQVVHIPHCLRCRSVKGTYNTVACLDVMIHYPQDKVDGMITHLAGLAENKLIISFAPNTLSYSILKRIGELFPGPSKVCDASLLCRHCFACCCIAYICCLCGLPDAGVTRSACLRLHAAY